VTQIAVINTDPVYLAMMAEVLAECGSVQAYRETTGAFEALKQERPDLIIVDIHMEKPDTGWNLLNLLTLDRTLRALPIIVCSAATVELRENRAWLDEHGIWVLPKPFDVEHLFQTVNEALASPHDSP
jgi:CheY-like chemotaxis protein